MKLSIIIPTLRPSNIERCLAAIATTMWQDPVTYETIVISPFEVDCDKWIPEKEARGTTAATNAGFEAASGEWVVTLADEAVVQSGWAQTMLQEMERPENRNNIGQFCIIPFFNFVYFNRQFSCFPFMRKQRAIEIGGMFDARYRSFYADPDLALRNYEAGGDVVHVPASFIVFVNVYDDHHAGNVSKYLESDRAAFRERWAHLGEFKDP